LKVKQSQLGVIVKSPEEGKRRREASSGHWGSTLWKGGKMKESQNETATRHRAGMEPGAWSAGVVDAEEAARSMKGVLPSR